MIGPLMDGQHQLAIAATAITPSTVPSVLWDTARSIHHFGGSTLSATIIVALLQGFIALFQYKTNPAGELIVPPGPTLGIEHHYSRSSSSSITTTTTMTAPSTKWRGKRKSIKQAGTTRSIRSREEFSANITTTISGGESSSCSGISRTSSVPSRYAMILNRLNQYTFLLLPLAAKTFGVLFMKQWHLMHIGLILSLARIFDIPATIFENRRQRRRGITTDEDNSLQQSMLLPKSAEDRLIKNVVVIGDSLAVGLGTVNVFDKNKNRTVDFHLTENVSASPNLPGPIFPKVLAKTLAKHQRTDQGIRWRSAGVDGGTVSHIRKFCLDVIRDEVSKGRTPDCVVLLAGTNDLKHFVSNPFYGTPRDFRAELNKLLVEIRTLCPRAKIVLPSFPTQMFRFNSPLNIFPLSFFLDFAVGFWESQKRVVVETFPSDDVMYVALSRAEINRWYKSMHNDGGSDDVGSLVVSKNERTLISADGVHPSRVCYAKWAESVGQRLCQSNV